MNRSRVLNFVAFFCLLICGTALITSGIAAITSQERWNLEWKDSGRSIDVHLYGIEWSGRYLSWISYRDQIVSVRDPERFNSFRNKLREIAQPNQIVLVSQDGIDVYRESLTNYAPWSIQFSRNEDRAGYIPLLSIFGFAAIFPIVRGATILLRRGRQAARFEESSDKRSIPLTARIDAVMTQIDGRLTRFAHLRARCPACNELVPRKWAWDQPGDHRCHHCYVLLRERKLLRRLANVAFIAEGWVFLWFTLIISASFVRRYSEWNLALTALAVIPMVTAWVYATYPYVTRFNVTPPRCQSCDYTLIGITGTICPECGTTVELPEFVM